MIVTADRKTHSEKGGKPKATEIYLTEEKIVFAQMTVFAYGWSELKVILHICIKYMKLHRTHLFPFENKP